jgi:signal transduction histidine kinase
MPFDPAHQAPTEPLRGSSGASEAPRGEERPRAGELYARAPVAIAAVRGPEHVFTLASARCERLFGQQELLGRRLRDALPEEEAPHLAPLFDRVYRSGEPVCSGEVRFYFDRRGDGAIDEGFFCFDLEPLVEAGSVVGVAAAAIEVTAQVRARLEAEQSLALAEEAATIERRRESELRAALVEAHDRSVRELENFAYITSHDLRAPLRGIANLSVWLEEDLEGRLNDDERERMRLLRGRVQRLEALIDGILRYSRAGRVGDRVEVFDLGELTAEVVELLAPADTVTLDVEPKELKIEAERAPFQQVISGLVSNAIKHAGRADPRIELTCLDQEEAYAITVTDDGQGIAPEHHERIWGMFQTLAPRDHVEGTGIGLSIVKKIVESRGGQVGVDSALGAGAAFHVLWPKRVKTSP